MRDLLPQLKEWQAEDKVFALATVISTWGSAPRKVGSYMAIRDDGAILGSVSGGCVEGAVIEAAQNVIASKTPKSLHFGVADENAWDVGLACGGEIDIFLQVPQPELVSEIIHAIETEERVLHSFSLLADDSHEHWALAGPDVEISRSLPFNLPAQSNNPQIATNPDGEQFFLNPILPSPQLLIIGGVQIAQSLADLARMTHFRPIIIDPRRAFLNTERFPDDQIIQKFPTDAFATIQPGPQTAIASLTHDPKIDDPALLGALASEAFYVGALGSRKTHAKRLARLEKAGASKSALERIQGPIGLKIGADNPEEIALAIMAQVIQAYRS